MHSKRRPVVVTALVAASLAATVAHAAPSTVDCSRKSLQAAVDQAPSGATIEIEGICVENVRLADKRLTLVGAASPGPHGIQGVASATGAPALAIDHSAEARLERLRISGGPRDGIAAVASTVALVDVEVSGQVGNGISAIQASAVSALRTQLLANAVSGLRAESGSTIDCAECELVDNGWMAVEARDHSRIELRDSEVSGERGLLAEEDGDVLFDCWETVTTHPCELTATEVAATALFASTVTLRAVGDFEGSIYAFDHAEVLLLGARQVATGILNTLEYFSRLVATSHEDETIAILQSRIDGGLQATRFSQVVLDASTELDGALTCSSAGDAWAEPGVVFAAGATISGCDHAAHP